MSEQKKNTIEEKPVPGRNNEMTEAKRLLHQYDKISAEYALATVTDPNKRFVQYPESLRLLGDLRGKRVFDIGCANGVFTRMIKDSGADEVVGFEPSVHELDIARNTEEQDPRGIEYISDYAGIPSGKKFDIVSAIMVVPAVNREQMEEIFSRAGDLLEGDGKFVVLTLNHDFIRFGEIVNNRRFRRRTDGRIDIDFFNEHGESYMSIVDTDFSQAEVEEAARKSGFEDLQWEKLKVNTQGIEELGAEYWAGYEDDCPYVGFVAKKHSTEA